MRIKSSVIGISLFLTSLLSLSVSESMANQYWNNAHRKECRKEFNSSFVESSRGIKPPTSMAGFYCDCMESALSTGDTLTDSINFCVETTYLKFKKWYDNLR
tara:strand:+ start:618 stop:923 length:306 start_codon:yes stop_codon:yes gene_type:complete